MIKMQKKKILILCFLLIAYFVLNCNNHYNLPCPSCINFAFGITMLDSTGIGKLSGFSIKAIHEKGDTFMANDTLNRNPYDSSYNIDGQAGVYRLEITNPNYVPIILTNVRVEQGRCSNDTRILRIIPERSAVLKKIVGQYRIVTDSIGIGCGN